MFGKPKRTAGKVIFLAMPTKGTALPDSVQRGRLRDEVYAAVAALHELYPDHTFVAPMLQDYSILVHLKKEPTWEHWADHCRRLIERSDEMWVMLFDGWSKPDPQLDGIYNISVGVRGEIEHAAKVRVPVSYVDPQSVSVWKS